jgi:hypothetical protein
VLALNTAQIVALNTAQVASLNTATLKALSTKQIAALETRANELTLGLAPNGSLGAGFSNDDREFMLRKLGDVANANAPMNIRLAAWEDVMERAARTTGTPYRKSFSSSAAVAPSTALPKGFKLD